MFFLGDGGSRTRVQKSKFLVSTSLDDLFLLWKLAIKSSKALISALTIYFLDQSLQDKLIASGLWRLILIAGQLRRRAIT